eukprot:SAG31_NODE_5004_length_2807_cov_1.624446_2_plen_214_part_00
MGSNGEQWEAIGKQLGAIGSNWEQLGAIGSNWEQWEAMGSNWEQLESNQRTSSHVTARKPPGCTAVEAPTKLSMWSTATFVHVRLAVVAVAVAAVPVRQPQSARRIVAAGVQPARSARRGSWRNLFTTAATSTASSSSDAGDAIAGGRQRSVDAPPLLRCRVVGRRRAALLYYAYQTVAALPPAAHVHRMHRAPHAGARRRSSQRDSGAPCVK